MKDAILIAGAQAGIGLANAKQLIARGYHVFGSVPTLDDAERAVLALGPDFTPLVFDAAETALLPEAAMLVRNVVGPHGLVALIHTAGAAPVPADRAGTAVLCALALTHAFLPLLCERAGSPPGLVLTLDGNSRPMALDAFCNALQWQRSVMSARQPSPSLH